MPNSRLNKKKLVTSRITRTALSKKPVARRTKRVILSKKPAIRRTIRRDSRSQQKSRPITSWLRPSFVIVSVVSFLLGFLSSYLLLGYKPQVATANSQTHTTSSNSGSANGTDSVTAALIKEVNPPEGYKLPIRYGNLGPQLLAGGAINYDAFAAIYQNAGQPLTSAQVEALKQGSDEQIAITPQNSYFLLNFFWAVGLANKNSILTDGPMTKQSGGHIENYASTGGWTLGTKSVTELYASMDLISLTPEQQARLEAVASAVYRPCCDNPTIFPDCNHGMAMLGLLELMASQNVSEDDMFKAAKYLNAYWFPQQTLEAAIYLKANQNIDFAVADPRLVTGSQFSSGSGFGAIHQQLLAKGLLPTEPGQGASCGS